ncbi:hypothetical protein [Klebsiella variicola]
MHWFLSLQDAQEKLDKWCWEYNDKRARWSLML